MPDSILYADDTTSPEAVIYHQAFATFYEALGDVADPKKASAKMQEVATDATEPYQIDALLAFMEDFFEAYEGTPDLEEARLAIRAYGVHARMTNGQCGGKNPITVPFLKYGRALKDRFVAQCGLPPTSNEGRTL